MLILEGERQKDLKNLIPTNPQWFIVKTEKRGQPFHRSRSELNKETFEKLFMELFGINAL